MTNYDSFFNHFLKYQQAEKGKHSPKLDMRIGAEAYPDI